MATKKSFKNPTLSFISPESIEKADGAPAAADVTDTAKTGETAPAPAAKSEPKPAAEQPQKEAAAAKTKSKANKQPKAPAKKTAAAKDAPKTSSKTAAAKTKTAAAATKAQPKAAAKTAKKDQTKAPVKGKVKEAAAETKDTQEAVIKATPQQIENVPEGFKLNPLYIEVKSKRVQLLMQPSLFKALKEKSLSLELSFNEYVHQILAKSIEDAGAEDKKKNA